MFDANKIDTMLESSIEIYIHIPTLNIFKEFCKDYFLDIVNENDYHDYTLEEWVDIYNDYYGPDEVCEGECTISFNLNETPIWGHCYKAYYERKGKMIHECKLFYSDYINISRDNLIEFLGG